MDKDISTTGYYSTKNKEEWKPIICVNIDGTGDHLFNNVNWTQVLDALIP